MAIAHTRKKQPDLVRRAILDEAIRLATEKGLAEVTIQAVASGAGVTKGGVFHHFASKQALIDALFADTMSKIDAEIERWIGEDEIAYGRFTRAYVQTLTAGEQFGIGSPFDTLGMAVMSDPALSRSWEEWLNGLLERHKATDSDPVLEIVRFAADGAWLSHLGGSRSREQVLGLQERLIAMTRTT
jgi:AcrR family transcriptional regulator